MSQYTDKMEVNVIDFVHKIRHAVVQTYH